MYKIQSENKSYLVEFNDQKVILNNDEFQWDLLKTGNKTFHIIKDNISYTAELIEEDSSNKSIKIKINNSVYTFSIQDKNDILIEKLGIKKTDPDKLSTIKAPMPGLIVELLVEKNQEVEKDQPLLILEAMKMENIIKASGSGKIAVIHAKKGNNVEKNELLIEFEK